MNQPNLPGITNPVSVTSSCSTENEKIVNEGSKKGLCQKSADSFMA